jgi:hypothetical protein
MKKHTQQDAIYSGSLAEQLAQRKFGTTKQAQVFYQKQWVDQFLLRQPTNRENLIVH